MSPESSLDFVEEVLIGCSKVSEDQAELGQGSVEDVVVVQHHLVVMLLTIFATCAENENGFVDSNKSRTVLLLNVF